jgi:adenylosuccinate synthase
MGNRLRESGNEYGAVTGRPRRCGWYDAVAVRYGVRINGLDALALTKLDVLDGLETIEVCTAYRCGGRTLTEMPSDLGQLTACEPVAGVAAGMVDSRRACAVTRTFRITPDAMSPSRSHHRRAGGDCLHGLRRDHTIVRKNFSLGDWVIGQLVNRVMW